jgi:hypothetical protein
MALFGGLVQEAAPVRNAAEVDNSKSFVSIFAPRKHARSRRNRRFYSTFSGANWRFSGMAQEAVPVHIAAELDDGEVFVSAFAARKAILLYAFWRLLALSGMA